MKHFFYLIIFLPLLFSCQQNYNTKPYDEKEKILRELPISQNEIILDSLWMKRDSLTYLRFQNLKSLYTMNTDSIPSWISQFKQLRSLQSFNGRLKLKIIPNNIGALENLTHIELPDNEISELPVSFFTLKNLQRVNLSKNKLNGIDGRFNDLNRLKIFLLSDNKQITNLPDGLCSLTSLVNLPINETSISTLPNCIGKMNNLKDLDISNTLIKYFPIEILNAPKLETIDAKGLKLTNYKEVKAICEKKNISFHYDE